MPQYIVLPNGAYFEVRKGESAQQATQAAMQQYPQAFEAPAPTQQAAPPVEQDANFSLGDTATAFKQGAVGSTKALTDVFGAGNAASNFLQKRQDELQSQYSPARQAELRQAQERMQAAEATGSTMEQIKAGLQNVGDAPLQGVAQGLGSFAPYAISSVFGAVGKALQVGPRALKALTTLANQAPKVIGTAQGMGAVKGAIYDSVYQAEMRDGVDEATARKKATDAQAYLGENLDQIAVGAGIGFVAGSTGPEKLFTPKGLAGAAAKPLPRVAGAMATETVTEGFQEGQERVAANKALQRTGRDVETFEGVPGAAAQGAAMGALAAGPVAAVRGPAPTPGLSPQEQRQAVARAAAAKEEEEKQRKQSPEYAQEIMQRYDTLVEQRRALGEAASAKVAKDDLAGQQTKSEARKALQELMSDPVTHETVREFNANKARIAELRKTPEEQLLEHVGVAGGTDTDTDTDTDTGIQPRGKARGMYPREAPVAEVDPNQQWVAQRVDWALSQPDMRAMNKGGLDDLAQLIMEDPKQAAAYAQNRPNIPGLRPNEQTALIKRVGKGLAALDTQAREAGRAGTAAAQLRNQSVEMEEQAFRDEQTAADEEQRRANAESAERVKGLTKEMQALRGMAERPGPYVPTPGAFSQNPTELVKSTSPIFERAAREFGGETKGLDLQFNEDRNAVYEGTEGTGEPAPTGPAQRVQGGFRLFNAQGAPDADTGFRPLQQRVSRLLASPDLTDEAYQFLRSVEDTMPQIDSQVDELRQGRSRSGPEQDTATLGSLYGELDTALTSIERGEQGTVTEGAPRVADVPYKPRREDFAGADVTPIKPAYKTDIAAVEAGQTPKRTTPVSRQQDLNDPDATPKPRLPGNLPTEEDLERGGLREANRGTARREEATTPRTLRGPSSGVRPGDLENNVPEKRGGKPLALPRMLSERMSLYQQARVENDGQRSLFEGVKESVDPFDGKTRPNVDKGAGDIKDSPEEFARFMNSPFVRKLRKSLREAAGLSRKATDIGKLREAVDALSGKVERMRRYTKELKTADAILRSAKAIAGVQLDAKRLSTRLTELVVDRMQLDGAIELAAKDEATLAKAADMARGNPAYKTLTNELSGSRKRLELLRSEQDALTKVLNTLDAQIKVAQASNTLAQKREAAPFPYALKEAEEALRGAQASLALAQSENTAEYLREQAEAGARKRAEEAVNESERARLQAARLKAENQRLKAMHGENREGVTRHIVDAVSEAQQEARVRSNNGEAPTLTKAQRTAIAGAPNQVLGGYRARVRDLERAMYARQKRSREVAGRGVEKLRATQDKLFEQYKAAKSSAERDTLGAKFDEASAALRAAEQRFKGEDVMWKGIAGDIKNLSDMYLKIEWLEDAIQRGDFEVRAPARAAKIQMDKTRARAEANAALKEKAEADAAARKAGAPTENPAYEAAANAPKTSGEALTRSQATKAAAPKKTVYQSKGGPERKAQHEQMLEDLARARADADRVFPQGKKAPPPLKMTARPPVKERPSVVLSEAAQEAVQDGRLLDALDELAENGSSAFLRKLAAEVRPLLPKVKLRTVQGLEDGDGNLVEGAYNSATRTVSLDQQAMTEEALMHEVVHAATQQALDSPDSALTEDQQKARSRLRELYTRSRNDPALKGEYAAENLKEFVAEIMSNRQVRDSIDRVKPAFLEQVYGAIMRMLGLARASTAAVKDIRALFAPPTAYSPMDRAPVLSIMRGAFPKADITAAPGTPDAIATAVDSVVGRGEQSWWQKVMANATGLGFRTQFIDAYAPAEKLLREGVQAEALESTKAFQTMYFLRFGQQRNQFLAQAANTGVPQLKNQGDGTYTYEADEGPNLAGIARILSDAGIGDPQQVEGEFTAYLAIRRASQIPNGYAKLNLKNPMSEAQAKAFMAAVKADPKRSEAYEAAAAEYKAYNGKLLDFLVQTGAMEPRKAAQLKKGDFVPFYRQTPEGVFQLVVMGESPVRIGDIRSQPYLQELMGDDEKIMPVFTGAMQNTSMLLDMGLRNQAVKSVAYTLRDMGAGVIGKGQGPRGARAKRDTVAFTDRGEDFFVKIDSEAYGVPAELLLKGLEGIKTTLPAIVKSMAGFSNVLRAGVTRMPAYAFRQLIRDPINAWLVTGGKFTPVLSSMAEMAKMQRGRSETEGVLERGGAISSNVFSGDRADWPRIMRNISGNTKGVRGLADQAMSKLDAFATQGDTATRAVLYNMYRDEGKSHMEALLGSLESMNFSRRGASPTMHFMSMMIPFFNAQIQGVDVIYRAARGQSLFENENDVRQKLMVRGTILTAATLAYAAAMQDDEAYKNATGEERANNFFVYLPGSDEPIKLPIPFELGYAFKAVPELIFNVAAGDTEAKGAVKTFGKLVQNTIPFGLPQAIKPGVEVATNYSFYGGQPILGARERGLDPAQQYRQNTTELAKLLGREGDVSPVKIDHLVRGYTGGMGLLMMQMINPILRPLNSDVVPERAARRLSEMPLIGPLFQPTDGRGIINEAFEMAQEFDRKSRTYKQLVAEGKQAEALAYAQRFANEIAGASMAGSFRQQMGEFAKYKRFIQAHPEMGAAEKRSALDALRQAEIALARRVKEVGKREALVGR